MSKTTKTPKVATRRTQNTLFAALHRAEDDQDKKRVEHIKNLLNGQVLLPAPNVKKDKANK